MIEEKFFSKTPKEISMEIADKERKRRKEAKLTQKQLSSKSGVSLGSLKRFEAGGEISLISLIKLSMALGYESDFEVLFSKKQYRSLQEMIDEGL